MSNLGEDGELATQLLPAPSSTWQSNLGFLRDCRMIEFPKNDLTGYSVGSTGTSWALPPIEGQTSAATQASDGARYRYVLPSVVTTFVPLNEMTIDSVADESTATLTPEDVAPEFEVAVASPQLNDSGNLAWNFPLNASPSPGGYRLTGTDQQEEALIQEHLFFASGLSGIAGGALIWLFGAFGAFRKERGQKPLSRKAREEALRAEPLGRQVDATDAPPPPSPRPKIRGYGRSVARQRPPR